MLLVLAFEVFLDHQIANRAEGKYYCYENAAIKGFFLASFVVFDTIYLLNQDNLG